MPKIAKFQRRHRKNPGEPKSNPPVMTDIVEYIVPTFAAFALDRFVTRIAAVQIAKRWPKYARHAGAIASIGTFGAAWFGAHRVKYLEKYHNQIVIGTGIAAAQSLIQIYLPQLGWMVSDCSPDLPAAKATAAANAMAASTAPLLASMQAAAPPQGFKPTTANEWYSYNDAYDAGSYRGKTEAAQQPVPGEEAQEPGMQISDLLDNSDLDLDNSDLGLS
jgi:hypothetical protein